MKRSINPRARRCAGIVYFGFVLFSAFSSNAQTDIPVGSWRLHLSYNNIPNVEVTSEKVYAASESGVLVFDRQEKTLNTFNKLNGLSGTGISSLKYDEENDQLLVGYADGDLDIIHKNTITNFSRLKDADVTTAKKINHISIRGDLAFLSTAYGVVLFDVQQLEIKETWRDLGSSGERLLVYQSSFLNDSIFLATDNGVLAGNMADNLLDYNKWTRYNAGALSASIQAIVSFNSKIYAAGPTGVYRFGDNNWILEPFLQTAVIKSLTASTENLFMITDSAIWSMDTSGELSAISDGAVTAPALVKQDEAGNFWIGDQSAGLVSNTAGTFSSYLPNGPSLPAAFRMVYDNGKLYALSGGFSASGQPLNVPGELNIFENGNWSTVQQTVADLTDFAIREDKTFIGSFGSGIAVSDGAGNPTLLDETNSPLVNIDPAKSNITALESSADGVWVANYGGSLPLHLFKSDGSWDSYSFSFSNEQSPIDLSVDGNGDVWMVLSPNSGGGLIAFERVEKQGHYKTNVSGSGALPDRNVRCVTTDRDGYTWVGTDAGVAYFFSATEDAIKPVYDTRFLLRDEKITALSVDGGNRKWIGTEHGVWLFTATGEALVHHFTSENSPLLSNIIRDIEIDPRTGEVFFGTDKGIISYRSDAISAGPDFEKLKIFPNPVNPGYNGTVGISGLASDAHVRITDISGKLIWQSQANGGMATWNVRDHRGKRASTGIYLVFAASEDGTESMVGKIAVIE